MILVRHAKGRCPQNGSRNSGSASDPRGAERAKWRKPQGRRADITSYCPRDVSKNACHRARHSGLRRGQYFFRGSLACRSASMRLSVNPEASIDRPTSAMLMGWKFPALDSSTSGGQFTYVERGKTALSIRSSRQRSRPVSRRSFKSRYSIIAAFSRFGSLRF